MSGALPRIQDSAKDILYTEVDSVISRPALA